MWLLPAFVVFIGAGMIGSYNHVSRASKTFVRNNIEDMPHHKVGLLLGTSKMRSDGQPNMYYVYRIEAAVALFKTGKVDYLLVSGDNRHNSYNEPREMRKSLLAAGVPDDRIILDYAGFRTLDSVIRSSLVFGQEEITIISQEFHIERALYIAKHYHIEAVGFAARNVPVDWSDVTLIREYFARIMLMLDLYIFDTQPKFLGEKVVIPSL